MKVVITVPEQYYGDVLGDVSRRRGVINEETQRGNAKVLDCFIPLAEMFGYVTDLRSLTQGRGNFTMTFDHYGETPRFVQDAIVKNSNMVLVMSKTHQSLHDRFAKTEAVARKESLFFDNEEAMAAYASTHPEQFPELASPKDDAETTRIAQEDSILDLSTLNKSRDEAAKMTSFDDFEKKKDEENADRTPSKQPKVNLTKEDDDSEEGDQQAMKDLAALEGGVPDEQGEIKGEYASKANAKK